MPRWAMCRILLRLDTMTNQMQSLFLAHPSIMLGYIIDMDHLKLIHLVGGNREYDLMYVMCGEFSVSFI